MFVLFGAVALAGDPPSGNWWSTDCYSSGIYFNDTSTNPPTRVYTHPGDAGFYYDWMLTRHVCEDDFSPSVSHTTQPYFILY